MENKKVISILGCGWFGRALALHFLEQGHTVKGSTTTPGKLQELESAGIRPYLIDLTGDPPAMDFFDCDIMIAACGAKIGALSELYPNGRLIFISSTGVYGNGEVDERSPIVPDKPHALAEQRLARAGLTVIRFAGLYGPRRLPGRFLAGKKDLPNGAAPVNLIHLDDCIGLTEAVLDRPDIRIINGVCPQHPDRQAFYQAAALAEGLEPPTFNGLNGTYKLVRTSYPDLYAYSVRL